jgi:hypothetical protein
MIYSAKQSLWFVYICTLPVQGGFVMGPVAAIRTTPKAGVQFQYFAFDKFRKT